MERPDGEDYTGPVTEANGLKIVTWNINGLRSLDNFPEWLRNA